MSPMTNSISYFADLDLWQLKAKSAEEQPELACVCALLEKASPAQPVLAPNLLHNNYGLKTPVMEGPHLLQIWHFNFKGMSERKGE